MEQITPGSILEHSIRFTIIMTGIGFATVLGKFRPEWRSRKTLICWVWTIIAADIIIMDGSFALSITAQLFIGGALILNVINFIGDRIETIKFKDFSASLVAEKVSTEEISNETQPQDESGVIDKNDLKIPEATPPKKK